MLKATKEKNVFLYVSDEKFDIYLDLLISFVKKIDNLKRVELLAMRITNTELCKFDEVFVVALDDETKNFFESLTNNGGKNVKSGKCR